MSRTLPLLVLGSLVLVASLLLYQQKGQNHAFLLVQPGQSQKQDSGSSASVKSSNTKLAGNSWDLQKSSNDARLSDQIQRWTEKQITPQSVSEHQQSGLKNKIKAAVQELRLSDFLTGVSPDNSEKQVRRLYAKLDPKDITHWRESNEFAQIKKKSKKLQLKEISGFQKMLENDLTTTKSQDTAAARLLRKNLKDLLQRKKQLQAEIEASENRILTKGGATSWVSPVHADPAQNENVIDRLARPSDASSSYSKWLQQAAAAKASHEAGRVRYHPSISAGGNLVWKKASRKTAAQARVESLAGRDPLLEPKGDVRKSWRDIKKMADQRVGR